MKVRKIKTRLIQTVYAHNALIRRKLRGLNKIDPKLAKVCEEIGTVQVNLAPPEEEKVKVVRKKDGELKGFYSLAEANAVIEKAKKQKQAALVIEMA